MFEFDGLGADHGVEIELVLGCFQRLWFPALFEEFPDDFAALGEGEFDELDVGLEFVVGQEWFRIAFEGDAGGFDIGFGEKAAGRDLEFVNGFKASLEEQGIPLSHRRGSGIAAKAAKGTKPRFRPADDDDFE